MRGTFFGIEIGRTGLSTAQFGLDTTGHNIANVDTAGYTRQRIVSTAYDPFATIGKFAPVGQALVGGGVRIQILDQIRSAYLDRRFRTENTTHAYWETRTQSLSYIESFFDNINEETSINTSIAEFFRSMKILSEDAISGASRTLMQTTGMDLVQQLNMIYKGLVDLQESENRAVHTKTQDINNKAKEIAELNKAIYAFELTGMLANDLRDKRNLLVDQLSELIDITYEEYPDKYGQSMFKVSIAGTALVDHDMTATLGTRPTQNLVPGITEPVWEVYWEMTIDGSDSYLRPLDWNRIDGGQLKAHINVRDGNEFRQTSTWDPTAGPMGYNKDGNPTGPIGAYVMAPSSDSRYRGIPYYVEMLNDLARALVQEINQVHRQGWSDNPLGSETNINFFKEEPEWITFTHVGGDEYRWNPTGGPNGEGRYERWDPTLTTQTGDFTAGGAHLYTYIVGSRPNFYDDNGNPITADTTSPDWPSIIRDSGGNEYMWDIPSQTWRPWDATAYTVTGDFDSNWFLTQDAQGIWRDIGGNDISPEYDPVTGDWISGFERNLDISKVMAKDLDIDDKIKDSAYNIAVSTVQIIRAGMNDPTTDDDPLYTQRGNQENMLALYALFSRTDITVERYQGYDYQGNPIEGTRPDGTWGPLMVLKTIGSFDDYGTVIRFDLGNTLHTAKQTGETSRILKLSAENQRTSVAGVSLDEEMVGLVRYQHAYNGASRVITAMDDALDRLINGTGRVGL